MNIRFIPKRIASYIKLLTHILLIFLLKILKFYTKSKLKDKTLVLVRLDAIGDFILWLQSAKYYRKIYPGYKIILFCNQNYQELANNCNLFDKVYTLDTDILNKISFKYNIIKRLKYLYNINNDYHEVLICDMHSRALLTSETISFLLHAKTKITLKGDYANINKRQQIITNNIYDKIIYTKNEIFEINKNFDFIKQISNYKIEPIFEPIDNLFNINFKNKFEKPYITINLGASTNKRVWPIAKFAELINHWPNIEEYQVILIGIDSEIDLAKAFISSMKHNNTINLIGKLSLLDVLEIIKFTTVFIGNESSCSHIAAALNTKSVTILGGGHFGRFMPYKIKNIASNYNLPIVIYKQMECFNCNWHCIYPLDNNTTWKCINQVDVNDVLTIITKNNITLKKD